MGSEKVGPRRPEADGDAADAEAKTPARRGGIWRSLAQQWLLLVVLVATIAIQGIALVYHHFPNRNAQPQPVGEIELGKFHFQGDKAEGGRIARAEFALHIALQESGEPAARQRLATRQFRVRQDIEELLRKAHGADFDDPALGDLKRQLLEQIDETLGMRVVADVIITGLAVQRGSPAAGLGSVARASSPCPDDTGKMPVPPIVPGE